MVTIAGEGLNACAGCEIALLNLGEQLLDLLPDLEFVHLPILMDNKYHGPLGRNKHLRIPKATVGLVSGGVRHSEHAQILHHMREQVDILVALGTCAITGGLPDLATMGGLSDLATKNDFPAPAIQGTPLPRMFPHCSPLHKHVRVNLSIAGCPPHPDWIAEGITALLEQRPAVFPHRSVCSQCPARRDNTPQLPLRPARRMLEQAAYDADADLSHMRCLLEQGFMCLGPITLAGCGGRSGAPKCIAARTPCRGCQGSIGGHSLPLADFAAALTAAGIDASNMPDKQGYVSRFTPAKSLL